MGEFPQSEYAALFFKAVKLAAKLRKNCAAPEVHEMSDCLLYPATKLGYKSGFLDIKWGKMLFLYIV